MRKNEILTVRSVFNMILCFVFVFTYKGTSQISGNISVGADTAVSVFQENDSYVYPGEEVILTISGQVNINPKPRRKRKCKKTLGIKHSCKTIKWTENHWLKYGNGPRIEGYFKDINDNINKNVNFPGDNLIFEIPLISNNFDLFNSYSKLFAFIKSNNGNNINRGSSVGSLIVIQKINSKKRVTLLKSYLEHLKMHGFDENKVIESINKRMLENHAEEVGSLLINFYENNLELKGAFGKIFKFLYENLPKTSNKDKISNYLSDHYLENFSYQTAIQINKEIVSQYQNKDSWSNLDDTTKDNLAKSFFNLGIAYSEELMLTNKGDLVAADNYYSKAQDLYEILNNQAKLEEILKKRTYSLRRIKTIQSLNQAKELLMNRLNSNNITISEYQPSKIDEIIGKLILKSTKDINNSFESLDELYKVWD